MNKRTTISANPISSWPPRIQIAGVSSLHEALFCAEVGVDAVGFTLELPSGIHDGLTSEKARDIILKLPTGILPVVITYLTNARAAAELAQYVNCRAMQFHGGMTDEEIRLFRLIAPDVKTIGRVTVRDEAAIEEASRFAPDVWDAIILDSFDPGTGKVGATGLMHDLSISAAIVKLATVPVILAGGLTPENVAQAITKVRPHGVDAHTGLENSDGTRNFDKIRRFAAAALGAFS